MDKRKWNTVYITPSHIMTKKGITHVHVRVQHVRRSKNCQKSNQKSTKNYWFCCKITQILSQNLPTFFTKISAIFPRKLVCVMWWPYVPNMVPTFMAGTKWFRGCSKPMSGRRATWVAPKVSEFDSGGADHLKFDIRVHHLRVIVWHQHGTNSGSRNQMVPGLYWAC